VFKFVNTMLTIAMLAGFAASQVEPMPPPSQHGVQPRPPLNQNGAQPRPTPAAYVAMQDQQISVQFTGDFVSQVTGSHGWLEGERVRFIDGTSIGPGDYHPVIYTGCGIYKTPSFPGVPNFTPFYTLEIKAYGDDYLDALSGYLDLVEEHTGTTGHEHAAPCGGDMSGTSAAATYADDDWGLPFFGIGGVVPAPWYDNYPIPGDAGVPVSADVLDHETMMLRSIRPNGRMRILVTDIETAYAAAAPPQMAPAEPPETITVAWKSGGMDIVIRLTPKGNEDPKDFVKRLTEYVNLLEKLFPPDKNTAGQGSAGSISVGNGGGGSGG